jgi:hypothetical protein
MKRWTTLFLAFGLVSVLAIGQQKAPKPTPADGVLGPQLIAWSEMQKPQPLPQQPEPLPQPDTKSGQQPTPDQSEKDKSGQDKSDKNAQQPDSGAQPSTAQSVSGIVMKVAGKYVLETADNLAYQLDDQDKARQYEGKRVKVTGTLDRTTSIIHVTSIELLS